ncbi:MAG: ABC transporter permease [Planctomycetes bacterium]|nr:ABC transporter permease [Planctomycetota bacterium]MCC8115636.1 ABC transporter permease [Planctomycetota bacterium]MCD7897508.1 ABC transporter permease [Planctomycetaceae bacterium]
MDTRTSEFLRRFGSLIGLMLLCTLLAVSTDNFMSSKNLINVLRQSSITALLALGVLLPILTGGTDLSVGSIQGFTMCFMAYMVVTVQVNSIVGIILTLVLGLAIGMVNGLLLTKLKLPHPFISTLGMLNIARGMALIITDGMPISGLPYEVRWLGYANVGPIPVSVILVAVVCVAMYVMLNHTPFGRHIYAIGGSAEAARLSGVNVNAVMNWVFAIAGFLYALGGIVLAGRVNSGYPLAGQGAELDAIAGAVIGGASLFGGEGTVMGTIIGVLIMGVLRNGLNLRNVSANWQMAIIGLVVILAVWVDVLRRTAEYKAATSKKV